MKPENNFLDELFETARSEEPRISFEEVSEHFITSTTPTLVGTAKAWLLKNISLNSVLIAIGGTVAISFLWLSNASSKTISEKNPTPPVTTPVIVSSSSSDDIDSKVKPSLAKMEASPKLVKPKKPLKKQRLNQTIVALEKDAGLIKEQIKESPRITTIKEHPTLDTNQEHKILKIPSEIVKEQPNVVVSPKRLETPKISRTFSPWVVGSGATHPDWGFVESNNYTRATKTSRVIQKCLDLEYLEKVFEKNEVGEFLPLTMTSNYFFADHVPIHFKGKKILVVGKPHMGDQPYIEVTRFKIKGNKATFRFKYKDHKISIQLRKKYGQWEYHKLKAKNATDKVDIIF